MPQQINGPAVSRSALPFRVGTAETPRSVRLNHLRGWQPGQSLILVVDDDETVAEGIVAMLEGEGRTVVVCHDAEAAQMALKEFPFTHVISDLQLSSIPFEGVHLVDAARRAQPDSRIVVVSGYGSHIVKSTALAVGADAFLSKPFDREELEVALGESLAVATDSSDTGHLVYVRDVDALLASRSLISHFQPIVNLHTEEPQIFAFEALARAGENWPFQDMRTLFEYAAQKRKIVEINAACIEAALTHGARLSARTNLFVNIDPPALSSSGFVNHICAVAASAGVRLTQIVLELTENAITYDHSATIRSIDALRALGVRFAIDDAESAVANLQLVEQIRPAYMKISHHMGTDFHTDPKKVDAVMRIVGLAHILRAPVILEGIESPATFECARQIGIEFGQGFWLGEPVDAATAGGYLAA